MCIKYLFFFLKKTIFIFKYSFYTILLSYIILFSHIISLEVKNSQLVHNVGFIPKGIKIDLYHSSYWHERKKRGYTYHHSYMMDVSVYVTE